MAEDVLADDQSHYEVSLTAGQAFLAFVLLLLSLAASFAFGLLLGRGDDRFLTAKKPEAASAVIDEASAPPVKPAQRDVAVKDDDFKPPVVTEEKQIPPKPVPQKSVPPKAVASNPVAPAVTPKPGPDVPHFAQLLSTSDQKTAEALAAKLIDGGFTSSYVERNTTDKGEMVFRVRIRFPSEAEAKAAEPKLKAFSKEVWITK